MPKLTVHHACHYRYEFASGAMTFLEIRLKTGLGARALEMLLTGRTFPEAGGPKKHSFAGIETRFPDEKRADAERYACYQRRYNYVRVQDRKRILIEMLGGRCVVCGATEGLQFDHIRPETKLFQVSNQAGKHWSTVMAEAKKCQLRCYTCHLEKTRAAARVPRPQIAGERHPSAQLTNAKVAQLRQQFHDDPTLTIRKLAEQLGMAEKVVRQMLRGVTYHDAGGPLASPEEAINYIAPDRKEQYRERVIELYRAGTTRLSDICRQVPVSSHTAKAYLVAAGLLSSGPKRKDNQPHQKLTHKQAREYRERYATGGVSQSALAREAGMSVPGMVRLLRGQSYGDAGGPLRMD